MNKAILLLVAITALCAFASARPLVFFADQTDTALGLSFGWAGITFVISTTMKGQNYHRVKIVGVAHLNESITDAWIGTKNQTIIQHLAINATGFGIPYFLADYRMNDTIFQLMTHEELYVTAATKNHPTGAITGYIRCRPYQGLAVLNAKQLVGSTSNSSAQGLGWASLDISTIFSLPQDILDQDSSIASNTLFNGRVIHEADNATSIGFFGPANTSETASSLASATLYNSPTNDGIFTNVTIDADFPSLAIDETYYQITATSGDIRGQIYALLSPTRRAIPFSVDTVNGATSVPSAGFGTLRYANQAGSETNSNSFVTLASSANPTNFTYLGLFTFKAATNKKNANLVRGITVEMNAKISGTGTWLFEVFDDFLSEFLPIGTLSSSDASSSWTPAYIDSFSFDTDEYANSREQIILRVSVNSDTETNLFLDLFGIRSWTPSSESNKALRSFSQIFNSLPGQFANGTTIN